MAHGIAIPYGMGIIIPSNKKWWKGIGLPFLCFKRQKKICWNDTCQLKIKKTYKLHKKIIKKA